MSPDHRTPGDLAEGGDQTTLTLEPPRQGGPVQRNDALLGTLPIGAVVFPGSAISDNLADKARKLGIPLFDFRKGGGA